MFLEGQGDVSEVRSMCKTYVPALCLETGDSPASTVVVGADEAAW